MRRPRNTHEPYLRLLRCSISSLRKSYRSVCADGGDSATSSVRLHLEFSQTSWRPLPPLPGRGGGGVVLLEPLNGRSGGPIVKKRKPLPKQRQLHPGEPEAANLARKPGVINPGKRPLLTGASCARGEPTGRLHVCLLRSLGSCLLSPSLLPFLWGCLMSLLASFFSSFLFFWPVTPAPCLAFRGSVSFPSGFACFSCRVSFCPFSRC